MTDTLELENPNRMTRLTSFRRMTAPSLESMALQKNKNYRVSTLMLLCGATMIDIRQHHGNY
jgi:hypothetical protein